MRNPCTKMLLDRTYADSSGYIVVTNPKNQKWGLYDINNNPTQVNNLTTQIPEQLNKMGLEYNTKIRKDFNNSGNFYHRIEH